MEFTLGEETEAAEVGKKVLSGAELSRQLDRLLEDKASNQRITDWVEVRLCCCTTPLKAAQQEPTEPLLFSGQLGRSTNRLQPVCTSPDDGGVSVCHYL